MKEYITFVQHRWHNFDMVAENMNYYASKGFEFKSSHLYSSKEPGDDCVMVIMERDPEAIALKEQRQAATELKRRYMAQQRQPQPVFDPPFKPPVWQP